MKLRVEKLEAREVPATFVVNTAVDESNANEVLSCREAMGAIGGGSIDGLTASEKAQVTGNLGKNDTVLFADSIAGSTIILNDVWYSPGIGKPMTLDAALSGEYD